MNRENLLFLCLVGIILTMMSFQVTYSLFASSSHNNSNSFSTAIQFPTSSISPTLTPTPTPIPTPQAGDIVINEINWGGSSATSGGSDEWIELKNTTSNPISLFGWVIENLGAGAGASANITISNPTATISANGFFLLSNRSKSTSRINVDPDVVTTGISLANVGEQLRLKTSTVSGVLIDTANPISGAWLAGSATSPEKSMERKSPPSDGTIGTNWQTATTHTGMDGATATDEFGTPKNPNGI